MWYKIMDKFDLSMLKNHYPTLVVYQILSLLSCLHTFNKKFYQQKKKNKFGVNAPNQIAFVYSKHHFHLVLIKCYLNFFNS